MRQLIIGVDSMEWDLVRRWASEGKLPAFQRLLEEGASAELSTTAGQLPDTVWASMFTSANPGNLEKYFYVQYDPATMGLRRASDEEITRIPFWKALSDAGKRVGVVDIPKFPTAELANGFQVANWGSHATTAARTSHPRHLIREIDERFGIHPVGDCDKVDDRPAEHAALRDRILDGVRKHGALFRWLMQEESWDVFFANFSGAHCIGHHFWRYYDPECPLHPSADPRGLGQAIEQVYQSIDRETSAMLEAAGPDVRCVIVSAHGTGPIYHASWNLPEILDLLGYGAKPVAAVLKVENRQGRVNPWRLLKMILPGSLQYAIRSALPGFLQDRLLFLWYSGGSKWKDCRAFAIPNNDTVGAIRISVKGRDSHGLVEPGIEYRNICENIRDALLELTDPVSGRPVVTDVTLTRDRFSGAFLDRLPDITVLWNQTFAWNEIHSPRFGTIHLRRQDSRTGSHTPHGFMIMHGPGVPAGATLRGHSIYDVAPTILAGAGVAIPQHFEGHPVPLENR